MYDNKKTSNFSSALFKKKDVTNVISIWCDGPKPDQLIYLMGLFWKTSLILTFCPLYNENYQLTITPVGVSLPSGQSIDEKHTQALTEPVPIANHQATAIVDSQIASQLATKDTTIDSLQAEITALKQQVAYLEGQADFANDLLRDVCKS